MEKTFHKIVGWKKKGRQTTKEKEEKKEIGWRESEDTRD